MRRFMSAAAVLFLCLSAGFLIGGCAATETEPDAHILRPRRLPRATDMVIVGDGEERPSIAF